MLKLEDIRTGTVVSGIVPGEVVRIVQAELAGDQALTVYYRTADGKLAERLLLRSNEAELSLAVIGRPWAFDAPGEEFKLAAEAYRINLGCTFSIP